MQLTPRAASKMHAGTIGQNEAGAARQFLAAAGASMCIRADTMSTVPFEKHLTIGEPLGFCA